MGRITVFKILKYLPYLALIEDIATAIKRARKGATFEINGAYRIDGRIVDVKIEGTPR